jgi:hypothetical protein
MGLREIGERVGRSKSAVSTLLKWRKRGYPGTAYGAQSAATRFRQKTVQSTGHERLAALQSAVPKENPTISDSVSSNMSKEALTKIKESTGYVRANAERRRQTCRRRILP